MRITYDPWADAAYFHIGGEEQPIVDFTLVDADTVIHLDPYNRIVALEVLAASERLNLDALLPEVTLLGDEEYESWRKLQVELWRCKQTGRPFIEDAKGEKFWISKVGTHTVTLTPESSSVPVTISEQDLDNHDMASHKKLARAEIVEALWKLGRYHSDSSPTTGG